MRIMKTIFTYILMLVVMLPFISCEIDLMEEEHYKKVIYLKSGDNNIFDYPHMMNDSITTGYITVGSGGSMPLTEDLTVSLEMDYEALESYNYRNYGEELEKYAQLLSTDRFVVPSFNTRIKAGEPSATAFVPIEIDVNGLSPDSTYMIPFRIKSAEDVEINETKDFVLYRIQMVNNYSSSTSRTYKMRGTKQPEGAVVSNITTNKVLLPLSHNQVRLFPENLTTSATLAVIHSTAIVLIVNSDNSVRVKPYKSIEIEQLDNCSYDPEEKEFTINYKYRRPGDSRWTVVFETLTRLE